MVEGVTNGFEKRLEIQGVGYRAQLKGQNLELALGYSHSVSVVPPEGIEFEVPQPTEIIVRGIDKQWSARSPRISASAASPSPTRARASVTGASKCPQGRKAGLGDDRNRTSAACAAAAGSEPGSSAPRSARASPCTAPTGGSSPSSIDDARARPWRRSTGSSPSCASSCHRAGQARRRAARRARQGRRDQDLRLDRGGTSTTAGSRHSPMAPARGLELLTATVGDSL